MIIIRRRYNNNYQILYRVDNNMQVVKRKKEAGFLHLPAKSRTGKAGAVQFTRQTVVCLQRCPRCNQQRRNTVKHHGLSVLN